MVAFPLPKYIDRESITKIKTVLNNLPSFYIEKPTEISLSAEAKNKLKEVAKFCEERLLKLSHEIGSKFEKKYIHQKFSEKEKEKLIQLSNKVKNTKQALDDCQLERRINSNLA